MTGDKRTDFKSNPLNPKLGLIWNPFLTTSVRAAFFRTLNVTRSSNQTLEPTQVAGFNQLFDDINGTIAWKFGGAVDHSFSKNLSAGFEYSERQLEVPSSGKFYDWSEQLGRAYMYYTPTEFLSLGVDYYFERYNRNNKPLGLGIRDIKSQWLPVTLNLFHSSGISLMLKSSYVNQYGLFDLNNKGYFGNSAFFIFDLNLRYRLPSRYGLVNLGIKNLFNNHFQYQSTNQNTDSIEVLFAPEMTLFTQVKLAF